MCSLAVRIALSKIECSDPLYGVGVGEGWGWRLILTPGSVKVEQLVAEPFNLRRASCSPSVWDGRVPPVVGVVIGPCSADGQAGL